MTPTVRFLLLAPACAALAVDARADPPRWQICTIFIPGRIGTPVYFRNCRPIPAACEATPTCACLARHAGMAFRYNCVRRGRRFLRGTVALP